MTTPKKERPLIKRSQTIESLTLEIRAYETAIADADIAGRGNLPHVELLRQSLGEMKDRLQILKQAVKE